MSGLTQATNQAYLDDINGTTARTAPTTPMKLVVETVAGTVTAAGTALGSTTPPTIIFHAATAANPSVAASNGTTTVTAGASGTVVALAIQDSAGTPVRKEWGALTASRAVVIADSLVFADSSIAMQFQS